MKIIIAGAGAVGFHLADLLAMENQNITVIDTDERAINKVNQHLDVATIIGDASLPTIMESAGVRSADLMIAVTTSEKANILISILAKKFGAKTTIARISNIELLEQPFAEQFRELGVDTLISPQQLAAQEISRLLSNASFTDLIDFENGSITISGIAVGEKSPFVGISVAELQNRYGEDKCKVIALLRSRKTVIPDKDLVFREDDHFYLSANRATLEKITALADQHGRKMRKLMIIGDTELALITCKLLEDTYDITAVMSDENKGKQFLAELNNTLVVIGDPGDIDELKEEGLNRMDALISLTSNSETNIVSSLMAKEEGVYKAIALVDNVDYTHISQNIGVDTIINKKLIAANTIFRFVRRGKIEAIASLHGVDAEVIEFEVPKKKRLVAKTIGELHFPAGACVAGIVRNGEGYVPGPNNKFRPGDKAIILILPHAIGKVEKIFAE